MKEKKLTLYWLCSLAGVIAAIMAHLFPKEEKNRYQWQPSPGGGYVVDPGKRTYERYE